MAMQVTLFQDLISHIYCFSNLFKMKRKVSKLMNLSYVTRVRRRDENIHPQILYYLMWQMCGDKEFLSFISEKIE